MKGLTVIIGLQLVVASTVGIGQSPRVTDAERALWAAVLRDGNSNIGLLEHSPLEVARRTDLGVPAWAGSSVADRRITLDETGRDVVVPGELFASARTRNQVSVSLGDADLPSGTVIQSRTCPTPWRLTLSRPGFSADGNHAIVALAMDRPYECLPRGRINVRQAVGETLMLERTASGWRVVARGFLWIN